MGAKLNYHFFEVCYSAQAVGARANHEISHMRSPVGAWGWGKAECNLESFARRFFISRNFARDFFLSAFASFVLPERAQAIIQI